MSHRTVNDAAAAGAKRMTSRWTGRCLCPPPLPRARGHRHPGGYTAKILHGFKTVQRHRRRGMWWTELKCRNFCPAVRHTSIVLASPRDYYYNRIIMNVFFFFTNRVYRFYIDKRFGATAISKCPDFCSISPTRYNI